MWLFGFSENNYKDPRKKICSRLKNILKKRETGKVD